MPENDIGLEGVEYFAEVLKSNTALRVIRLDGIPSPKIQCPRHLQKTDTLFGYIGFKERRTFANVERLTNVPPSILCEKFLPHKSAVRWRFCQQADQEY